MCLNIKLLNYVLMSLLLALSITVGILHPHPGYSKTILASNLYTAGNTEKTPDTQRRAVDEPSRGLSVSNPVRSSTTNAGGAGATAPEALDSSRKSTVSPSTSPSSSSRSSSSISSSSSATSSRSSTSSSATSSRSSSPSSSSSASSAPSGKSAQLVRTAKQYTGVKYVWGGTSPAGFDCSGFIQYVFAKNGITLPRVSRDQYKIGKPVAPSNLRAGDLLFFSMDHDQVADHEGMYIGGGSFIQASSSKGVTVSSFNSYWKSYFLGAKRVL